MFCLFELGPHGYAKLIAVERRSGSINEREVMSVSRRPERLFETPSAIQVITQNDIRRSGARVFRKRCASPRICRSPQVDARNGRLARAALMDPPTSCWSSSTDGPSTRRCFQACSGTCRCCLLSDIDRIEVISGRGHSCGAQRRQRRDQRHHQGRERYGGLLVTGVAAPSWQGSDPPLRR